MMTRNMLVVSAGVAMGSMALGQTAPVARAPQYAQGMISAEASNTIVQHCYAYAKSQGKAFGIVVLDVGGRPVASLRMDGKPYGIIEMATAKATTAAAWGRDSATFAQTLADRPLFAHAPNLLPLAGGVVIWDKDGRTRLGAVGVSGETSAEDADCGARGIVAAGLRATPAS